MAQIRCFCGIYKLDPEHALYVKDGIPLCSSSTCQQVAKNGTAIRVTIGDDPGDENDHFHRHLAPAEPVPDIEHDRVAEIYGRCRDDGSLVWTANRRRFADI